MNDFILVFHMLIFYFWWIQQTIFDRSRSNVNEITVMRVKRIGLKFKFTIDCNFYRLFVIYYAIEPVEPTFIFVCQSKFPCSLNCFGSQLKSYAKVMLFEMIRVVSKLPNSETMQNHNGIGESRFQIPHTQIRKTNSKLLHVSFRFPTKNERSQHKPLRIPWQT